MVDREGLEPSTLGLRGPCSNRLSYQSMVVLSWRRSHESGANITDRKRNANDFSSFSTTPVYWFPKKFSVHPPSMRALFPLFVFAATFALQAFVRSVGWDFLVEVLPQAQKYWTVTDRSLSALSAVAGLWLANAVALVALDKTFSKVLKSSPLAKKILPLLKYASTVLIWGFGFVFVLSIFGVNVSTLLT